jgi:hypothetical protein
MDSPTDHGSKVVRGGHGFVSKLDGYLSNDRGFVETSGLGGLNNKIIGNGNFVEHRFLGNMPVIYSYGEGRSRLGKHF